MVAYVVSASVVVVSTKDTGILNTVGGAGILVSNSIDVSIISTTTGGVDCTNGGACARYRHNNT